MLVPGGVVALLAISGLAAGAVRTHDRVVEGSEAVNVAWGHLDSALQRRADLVPRLRAVAEAHAAHERALLVELAEARDAYVAASGAHRVAAARRLDGAIADVTARVEAFPASRSSASWSRLRSEIVGGENRIAIERRRYNEAVRRQRTLLRSYPGRLIAPVLGAEQLPEY